MYYLAYGSNLNKDRMKMRCPDAQEVCVSEIKNYRLLFRRGVLTIEPAKGYSVPVAVWEVSDRDIRNLDIYEGYPSFYYKQNFMVYFLDGKRHKTFAYLMHRYAVSEPRPYYFDVCLTGYDDFGIDPKPMYDALDYTRSLIK